MRVATWCSLRHRLSKVFMTALGIRQVDIWHSSPVNGN